MTDDLISRQAAIYAVDSETVSTNPEHFKSSQRFIKFMDDTEIASFGKWQWANGFNTALTAITIQLSNLPSAQPTLYGYDLRSLMIFADAVKKKEITESEIEDFARSASAAWEYAWEEFQRTQKEALDSIVRGDQT